MSRHPGSSAAELLSLAKQNLERNDERAAGELCSSARQHWANVHSPQL